MANDVWSILNMTGIFPKRSTEFTLLQDGLDKINAEASKVILNFTTKALAANQALEVTIGLLEQMKQTGFGVLYMPPKSQDFFERLANSNNQPFPNDWTAGICIFVGSPSIVITSQKYKALLDILAS